MTIYIPRKGQVIDFQAMEFGKDGDQAVVLHNGEYFVARFEEGRNWGIWHEYGFKSAFAAMIDYGFVRQIEGSWIFRDDVKYWG